MPEGDVTRWWWEEPKAKGIDLSWPNILSNWAAIETDFHHFYNIDFGTGVLTDRDWQWFTLRLFRLLGEDTRLARALGVTGRT